MKVLERNLPLWTGKLTCYLCKSVLEINEKDVRHEIEKDDETILTYKFIIILKTYIKCCFMYSGGPNENYQECFNRPMDKKDRMQ
jgi:hypothetical protein